MVAKTLKPWSFVKDKKHDLTNILRKPAGQNKPEYYYYQLDHMSNIYSPACLTIDLDSIPERNGKKTY